MKEAKAPVGRTEAGKTKNQGAGEGKERNTRRVHATLKSLPGPLGDTSTHYSLQASESRPLNANPSVPMQHSTVNQHSAGPTILHPEDYRAVTSDREPYHGYMTAAARPHQPGKPVSLICWSVSAGRSSRHWDGDELVTCARASR